MSEQVTDQELTAIVEQVRGEERWTFVRVQDGYPDGVPRLVLADSEGEPVGIPFGPMADLVGRLAADLRREREARAPAPSAGSVKGYVVRGTDANGKRVHQGPPPESTRLRASDGAPLHAPSNLALAGWRAWMAESFGARGMRVYAVAEDGSETPLPTYEEAVAIVDLARRRAQDVRGRRDGGAPRGRCQGRDGGRRLMTTPIDHAKRLAEIEALLASAPGGVWTWEPHGDGWALYADRGAPIDPSHPAGFGNMQHGWNLLTVGRDGFDANGEALRAFIAGAGPALRDLFGMLRAASEAIPTSFVPICDEHGNDMPLDARVRILAEETTDLGTDLRRAEEQAKAASEALTAAGIPDDGRSLAERVKQMASDGGWRDKWEALRAAKNADDLARAQATHDADILRRAARAAAVSLGEVLPDDAGPKTIAAVLRRATTARPPEPLTATLPDLGIVAAHGDTPQALAEDVASQVLHVVQAYALAEPETLAPDAVALRARARQRLGLDEDEAPWRPAGSRASRAASIPVPSSAGAGEPSPEGRAARTIRAWSEPAVKPSGAGGHCGGRWR